MNLVEEHPVSVLCKLARSGREELFGNEIITFLNPYSYLYFRKHLALFSRFDRIYFDGIIMAKSMRLLGVKSQRMSFDMTSKAPKVFNDCQDAGKSIYFIGSDPASIAGFGAVLSAAYPTMSILGLRNGYLATPEERLAAIADILKCNPNYLVVGMGTPLQEQFLIEVKAAGWNGVGFTCGGFIHQTAKGLDYYPVWMDRLHLRWLFRIWDEPKLLTRYLFQYPRFVALFIYDVFTFELAKRQN